VRQFFRALTDEAGKRDETDGSENEDEGRVGAHQVENEGGGRGDEHDEQNAIHRWVSRGRRVRRKT